MKAIVRTRYESPEALQLEEVEKTRPVIDRCYPLAETAEAIRYLEEKYARGKVIIIVDHNKDVVCEPCAGPW
jgi:D-arabinose 1-dehydrogenase-like Zn-dependent alcohol dehydrogenase